MSWFTRVVLGAAVAAGGLSACPAWANPYIWITAKATIDYSAIGVPTAIRYAWRFDKSFSGFAAKDIDSSGDGKTSPTELAASAAVNMAALAKHAYFTHISAGGHTVATAPARDYTLSHEDGALTLRFTLPLERAPASEVDALHVKLYDPAYFVALTLAPGAAVKLDGAPAACAVALSRPHPPAAGQGNLATKLDIKGDIGARYANVATVTCDGQALAFAAPTPSALSRFPPLEAPAKAPATVTARAPQRTAGTPAQPPPPREDAAARISAALGQTAKSPLDPYIPSAHPIRTAALTAIGPARVQSVSAATVGAPAHRDDDPLAGGFSIRSEQLLMGFGILGIGAALLGALFFRGGVIR